MPNNQTGWKDLHEYKHPGNVKVRLTLFWKKNVTGGKKRRVFKLVAFFF
ncbi:MAG: hypothetical protein M3209_12580 [Acidobacteriota bacterium]|nr:hypothetical protein [Acidobacteriota bacterium]